MKWKSIINSDGRKGVRYREHPTRKHGAVPDRYYSIYYWWEGKAWAEGVGWASDNVKPSQCFKLLETLKNNQARGEGPCTLAELRKAEADRKILEEAEARRRAITVADYYRLHYQPWAQLTKPKALEKEEVHFRIWIEPCAGKTAISEISHRHWEDLVRAMTNAGRSERTRQYVCGTLRQFLKHAYERRLIDTPPPSGKRIGVTAPKNNRRLRVITPSEAEAILGELRSNDIHAWRFVRFGFLTGCRASEAYNLRWGGISLDLGTLVFMDTKNKADRTLPLSRPLLGLLTDIMAEQGRENATPESHVFTDATGLPYKAAPDSFRYAVARLGLNNGRTKRDRLTFHSIRHTVATALAKRLNLRDLQETLGWKTVIMAVRYVHGDDAAKLTALDGLDRNMEPQEGKVLPFRKHDTA